jgi:alkaline phosphatase D
LKAIELPHVPSRKINFYYVQGKLAREWTVPKGSRLDPMRGMNIGADKFASPASGWDGWLDDFALFDVELTPEQIGALVESTGAMASITVQNVIVKVPEPGAQQLADSQAKLPEPFVPAHETMPQGPQLGHVGERNAIVWARVPRPGRYEAIAMPDESTRPVSAWAEATAENDWCLRWEFDGLQPQTVYRVVFSDSLGGALPAKPIAFKTAPQNGRPAIVTLGFGSCASFDDGALWSSIAEHCPDGMVLLGDTPYIDRTELNWVRWAHRRFASGSELDDAFRRIPVWGTWDDHDFGKNNSDGTVLGKENNRKGFMEYRANPYFGEDGQGIYTHFRRGPIEVFLLDTRWFSNTEPSYADTHRRTLLGARQWEWLKGKLLESTAPFKVLACGMIWNEKAAGDSWGSYLHEREALFRWLGDNRIEGVVLMGGDIHVSRLLRHNTKELVGYDLTQFISSPLHDRLIPSANVPDPELIASAVEPRVFLKLTADTVRSTPILIGELVNSDGKQFFRQEISVDELRHRDGR